MNLYLIIDRLDPSNPIVKHKVIEGWLELDNNFLYQCLADENDPKKVNRIPILKSTVVSQRENLLIKIIWTSCDINDKNIYDKIQIVPED
jgi:hypothetical protein